MDFSRIEESSKKNQLHQQIINARENAKKKQHDELCAPRGKTLTLSNPEKKIGLRQNILHFIILCERWCELKFEIYNIYIQLSRSEENMKAMNWSNIIKKKLAVCHRSTRGFDKIKKNKKSSKQKKKKMRWRDNYKLTLGKKKKYILNFCSHFDWLVYLGSLSQS